MFGSGSAALFYACKNKMKNVAIALIATGESNYYLITNASATKFLKQVLDEMKMTAFITASQKANIGFTAENLTDIYRILSKAKTQNAGKGTTTKGTTTKGTTTKGTTTKGTFRKGTTRKVTKLKTKKSK